jgi:protein-S-isoprenylcysteine O-methyltransferase Ste14
VPEAPLRIRPSTTDLTIIRADARELLILIAVILACMVTSLTRKVWICLPITVLLSLAAWVGLLSSAGHSPLATTEPWFVVLIGAGMSVVCFFGVWWFRTFGRRRWPPDRNEHS